MYRCYLIAFMLIVFSCNSNGQNQNRSDTSNPKKTQKGMQNIDLYYWKEKANNYQKNNNGEGEVISTTPKYYYLKEEKNNILYEFTGDDSEGFSLVETKKAPNIYSNVNFYRSNGNLLYKFSTLTVNPKIVVGEHLEFSNDGKVIKRINYDEGFVRTPEEIVAFIKNKKGEIFNDLTIIDRHNIDGKRFWHLEFLTTGTRIVQIYKLEDKTLQILSKQERDSDFLED